MDFYEKRLRQNDVESVAVNIAERDTRGLVEFESVEYHLVSSDDSMPEIGEELDPVHTPDIDSVMEQYPPKAEVNLSLDEVEQIKRTMSKININHKPSWADCVSDEQLVNLVKGLVE